MTKKIERMTLSERRYRANVMLAEARRVIADRVIQRLEDRELTFGEGM